MVSIMDRPTSTPHYGEMQDRIRQILLSYGTKEVFVTIDDLVGKTTYSYPQIYQTLFRLRQLGELDILKDEIDGREKVSGVVLKKMEPVEEIVERNNERTAEKQTVKELPTTTIPATLEYLNQKTTVERARLQIISSNTGLNPDDVITFTENLLGEEAIILLARLQEEIKKNKTLVIERDAAQSDVAYYKRQLESVTPFGDSGT